MGVVLIATLGTDETTCCYGDDDDGGADKKGDGYTALLTRPTPQPTCYHTTTQAVDNQPNNQPQKYYQPQNQEPKMSYFRITLHRSFIGLPKRTRDILAALGLHRRGKIVFQAVNQQSAGMIMKVKELVKVEEVDRALSKREVQDARRPDTGFWVETAARARGGFVEGEGNGNGKGEEEVRL